MYEDKRVTLCVSTQVGCAVDCKFCATAKMGFIKNLTINQGHVTFEVELTTPACPVKETFKQLAEQYILEIDGVEKVNVYMKAQQPKNPLIDPEKKNLKNVTSIIAVSSCKGGVGKSTVAVKIYL